MRSPFKLETFRFVPVNDSYVRIGLCEGAQLFQAYIAASRSRLIPATWRDASLERPGEVARIAGQENWHGAVYQIRDVIVGVAGHRDCPKGSVTKEVHTRPERRH